MSFPTGPRFRHRISSLLTRLSELLEERGALNAEEVCRDVLCAAGITGRLARNLVRTLVAGDDRFQLAEDGGVRAAAVHPWSERPLALLRFTVFDLETTGGSPTADRILEFGAVRVEAGRIGETFTTLINPGVPISPFVTDLTGIDAGMIASAPSFHEIADAAAGFLADSVVVAHNSSFDFGFLNRELSRHRGYVLANPGLCTVRIARRLLPELPDRRLDTVAGYYGFTFARRHRAFDDALVTSRILIRFLDELGERGIVRFGQLQSFLAGEDGGGNRAKKVRGRGRRREEHSPSRPSAGS
jgi:DNA polymerase III subunit epsilon